MDMHAFLCAYVHICMYTYMYAFMYIYMLPCGNASRIAAVKISLRDPNRPAAAKSVPARRVAGLVDLMYGILHLIRAAA
jgi:hypothetical protein